MDEFLKLNWSWKHILLDTDQFYNSKFTDDEKDVFYCHLHEIDHIHLLRHNDKPSCAGITTDFKHEPPTLHKYIDPRTKKEVKQVHINHYFENLQYNDHLFNRFHEKSKFPSFKHRIFLRVLDRLLNNNNNNNNKPPPTITDADRKDLELYMSTWESRQCEEICFQNFVQKYFYANLLSRCRDIFDATANEIIQIEWQQSIQQIKQKFATFNYNLETAIPLNPPCNNNSELGTNKLPTTSTSSITSGNNSGGHILLAFNRVIKKSGLIWQYQKGMVNSHLRNSYILPMKIPMPDNSASITTQCFMSGVNILLNIPVIENILCGSFDLTRSWNIPFEIKEFPGNRPVCFFKKPLPKIFLTSQYCNEKSVELKVHNLVTNIDRTLNLRDLAIVKNFSGGNVGLDSRKQYKLYEYDEFSKDIIKNKCYSSYMSEMYVLKNQTDELNLMIESENDVLFEEIEESRTFVNISTKCEYQCEFGAEKMSRNELIREWCKQRFKSGTITDRFRVDITTGQITNVTRLTTANIESELLRLYKIKPTDLYQILWETLNIIMNFPPKSYLLSHNPKHGNKAMIYGSTDKKTPNTISIEKLFKTNPDEILILDQIYWNPIDELHITQRHRNANILPCLFPPEPFSHDNSVANKNNNQVGRVGKKNKSKFGCKGDDRIDRINHATKKNQEKQEKIKLNEIKRQQRRRQAKRKKRAVKHKAKREQQKCDNAANGESIDPYEWFDVKGNISMGELKSTNSSAFISSLNNKKEDHILVGDSVANMITTESSSSSTLFNDYSLQAQCSLPNLL